MKKIILLALIGVMAVNCAACSSSNGKESSSQSSQNSQVSGNSETSQPEEKQEEKVIYDENKVKVIFTGVSEGAISKKIGLKIENNSGKNLIVQSDNLSINDYMFTPMFSAEVNKGKTANDAIEVLTSDLEKNKIDKITSADFELVFINPDSFETIFKSGTIKLDIK